MTLTDQEVIDIINDVLARKNVRTDDRLRYLHQVAADYPPSELKPLVDRYLRIVDPPRLCQVTHPHWEGPMICGNPMPCRTHGGR